MNRNKRRSRSNRKDHNNKSATVIQPLPYGQYNRLVVPETAYNNEQSSIGSYGMCYVSEQQQKEMIGEELYYYVYQWYPERAGKLTGMLLEMDVQSLLQMLADGNFMRAMVEKALQALMEHYAKQKNGRTHQ
ncbi:uncharacterized protein LOC129956485 [Argiope bruennichi]|uniref:Embryonic polyadenylate-binding protein like n=1 Tax=Argiope bruennichi TaxID=94029 RepID=A0A8T0FCH5_ARGBR|nr:uncharacterized protein LOC129956485 [Argiope bruennichi]KAF8788974.1 Embryonic polyadenylate-binding protein like [Argiope bruennichi]